MRIENEKQAEVVVVGAGPTGLTLAHELALAGVETLVLERLERPVEQVKGGGIQPRTTELLESRGLLAPVLSRAMPRDPGTGHFAMLPVPLDCTPWRTRHPYPVPIPQWQLEAVLAERAVARGARILRGTEVTAVTTVDGDGIDGAPGADGAGGTDGSGEGGVTVTAGGLRVRARYLVACDGGRSTVRKLLGLPFPGRDGTYVAVLADVRLSAVSSLVPRRSGHISSLTREAGGHWAMLVPVGDDRYRFTFGRTEGASAARDVPVTRDEIASALRAVYGDETVLGGVVNAGRFTDATRQLVRYREGRVLFAGDAAHIHPPLGGQGLNLGVQDAFNLGWKLAAAVRGRAPDGLLDSYHAERHPAAARVLHHTSAQRVLAGPAASEDVTALRDIVTDLLRLPDANRHIAGLMSGLSLRYDLAGEHPLTGHRLPDLDLDTAAGPTRLSALLHAGHAVLLDLAGVVPAGLSLPAGVDLVRAGSPDDPGAAAVLLRPDGYVCWASDDAAACTRTLLPALHEHVTAAA
ncbi:FAD-dependent monooxygenase [Streptomyces sp. TS71-3]|uniref:FAD-dependent monooxygenase n=1 Tax=Streptomyces sp. TS71-3 TaxID=2733862 RepID=UPI001B28616A|nr:3-(3-hydroxyphenyl)propionate hydroxylase [Streptomyces sp. TS71-3]